MQRRRSLLALGLSALGPLGLSRAARAEDKPTEIRIAYPGAGSGGRPLGTGSYLATAHLQGAIEKEFAADGIKVKWLFFPGAGPAVNEATANGLVDFAGHGDLPLIVGRSTGLKHKVILAYARFAATYFLVPSDSQARTLADLKGQRISTFKGTATQLLLNRVLERYQLGEKDFKVVSLDTETTKASLATRDIAGTVFSETSGPFAVEARGVAKILLDIPRDPQVSGVTSFWVSEAFEARYPAITQRVVNALLKVAAWNSDEANREKVFQLWAQSGQSSFLDYQRSWKGSTLKERVSPLLDPYYVASIKKAIDESKRYKLIRRDVSTDGWIEPKYLQAGLKQLGLENFWPAFDAAGKPVAG